LVPVILLILIAVLAGDAAEERAKDADVVWPGFLPAMLAGVESEAVRWEWRFGL